MFKIDLEENYKNIKCNNIFLLVNDICNANCDYCIMGINNFLGNDLDKLDLEMSLDTFKKVLRKAKNNKIGGIVLAGKEPLIWSNLNDAIKFAEELKIHLTIFSNGINNNNIIFNKNINIVLHIDKDNIKADYLNWFKKSKKEGFKLSFMCVVGSGDSVDKLNYYINIISKYGDGYVLSPVVPTGFGLKGKISIAKMLYIFKKLYSNGYKNYQFAHPIANCMIKKDDLVYLYKNKINFYGTCALGNDICIDYKGNDYYPCPGFPRKKKIGNLSLNEIGKEIFKYASDLRYNHPPKEECYNCGMYKNGKCQGGCLIERVI